MFDSSKNVELQHTASVTHNPSDELEGVVVEGELDGRRAACSGFTFAAGQFVLTQGALLSALQADVTPVRQGELLTATQSPNLRLNIMKEKSTSSENVAQLSAWWSCHLITKSSRMFRARGWQFTPNDDDVLGLMLVLSVGDNIMPLSIIQEALISLLQNHVTPTGLPSLLGSSVLLESTPFAASPLFLNSWTRGVVSAVTGESDALFLCDVHAAPGCEGGAVYAPKRDVLLGMVVQPFCIVRGEAVALCLCAAFGPVLTQLFKLSKPAIMKTPVEASQHNSGVALLRRGFSWASAVAIQREPAIFLTCSHVFEGTGTTTLQWPDGGEPRPAKVLFRSSSNAAFDLAVLRVDGTGPRFPPPSHSPSVKGEEVVVCGYSVLSPPNDARLGPPLLSRGCVSKVSPAMLQTTCVVQSGASGGAVLRAKTYQLLGIVVGNMKVLNADPLPRDWPRINFAVPVAAIAPAIRAFLTTGDSSELQVLESKDLAVQDLWKLDRQCKL